MVGRKILRAESGRLPVLVIGPTRPLRGGIPLYTSAAIRHLGAQYEVRAVGFTRLYPRWLYPGRSQYEAGVEPDPNVAYWVDLFRPTAWHQLAKIIRGFSYGLILAPWWASFWAPLYTYVGLLKRVPLILMCHNFIPHERKLIDYMATVLALRIGDAYLAFSSAVASYIQRSFPSRPVAFCRLPSITRELNLHLIPKDIARNEIGIPRNYIVFLFWGIIRRYKGLELLLKAMAELSYSDVCLLVVGEFWDSRNYYAKMIEQLGLKDRVLIWDYYMPLQRLLVFISAADAVVLPYRDTSQSAVLRLTLDLGVPAIAADLPGLREVAGEAGQVLFHEPGDHTDLARRMEEMAGRRCLAGSSFREVDDGWSSFIEAVNSLVEAL